MPAIYGERWEVVDERPLGEGSQAQTYLVKDLMGDPAARFALKRLKNLNRIERFEQEIEAIKSINHPNVLSLVDYSLRADGKRSKPYMVAEYCEGGSVAAGDQTRWSKDVASTLDQFAEICDGVAAAHMRKPWPIVHRDIKPENVLLRTDRGPAVVADFGIAFVDNGERERLTATDEAVGARLFIAPELADGRADEVQPWSDVYSLGKLLYWMLSGGRVFDRERHRDDRWNLLIKYDRNGYEHVNRLLDRMITLEPKDRYPNAQEAAAAARFVAKLIRKDARALGPGLRQYCDFCKQGEYQPVQIADGRDYHNFVGTLPISGAQWRILVCEECGHVQWFRIEKANGRVTWWGKS